MGKYEVLGLPLSLTDLDDPDYVVSPIGAIVIFKGMDSDGDEVHTMTCTDGMTWIEALGLLEFGKIFAQAKVMNSVSSVVASEQSQEK